jgi:thiol-disulfide isomerase/thioredoxin
MRRIWPLILIAFLTTLPALADTREFDDFAYRRANLEKKLVILDFHTKFCPRCRGQSPLVERAIGAKHLDRVQAFLVDFERDAKFTKLYDVRYKSTILFLYQGRELERVTGDIRHEALEAAIRTSLDHAANRMPAK